ncbi:MAG: ABC transporter permease, partial [Trebonia sp.]
ADTVVMRAPEQRPAADGEEGRLRGFLTSVNLPGWGFILLVAILWQIAVESGLIAKDVPISGPIQIIQATVDQVTAGALLPAVWHTLYATLVGWVVASVVGIAIGVWLGLSPLAWRYSIASLEAIRAIPGIALVPLLLLIFGFDVKSEIALSALTAVWPVVIFTIAGVQECSPMRYAASRVLHLGNLETVRKIVLPSAVHSIVVGLRLGMQLALALTIVSEAVGNPAGIGYQVINMQSAFNIPALYGYTLCTGLLGYLLNGALTWAMRAGLRRADL